MGKLGNSDHIMTRYKAAALFQIWQDGKTLKEALREFDPQADRAKLLRDAKFARTTSASAKRNWHAAGIDADPIIDTVEKIQTGFGAASDAYVSQQDQLIAALENGDLIALGYQVANGSAAKVELVPQFMFQRQFAKIQKSEFNDGERRFSKVRIAPANALTKPKIGRPSIKEKVFAIAEAIENQIRHLKPGEQAREVHREGMLRYPNDFTKERPVRRQNIWHNST